MARWLISVSVEEWNRLVAEKKYDSIIKSTKIKTNDTVCFYVRGTSSIKGLAQVGSAGTLQFQKVGDLNYFGVASSLSFVRDKDNVVKYLKNFGGVSNLGRPIPEKDLALINSQIAIQDLPKALEPIRKVVQIS